MVVGNALGTWFLFDGRKYCQERSHIIRQPQCEVRQACLQQGHFLKPLFRTPAAFRLSQDCQRRSVFQRTCQCRCKTYATRANLPMVALPTREGHSVPSDLSMSYCHNILSLLDQVLGPATAAPAVKPKARKAARCWSCLISTRAPHNWLQGS